jgi:hypothetical protein
MSFNNLLDFFITYLSLLNCRLHFVYQVLSFRKCLCDQYFSIVAFVEFKHGIYTEFKLVYVT